MNEQLQIVTKVDNKYICNACGSFVLQVYYSLNKCKCEDCKAEYLIEPKNIKKKNLISHQR